MGYRVVVAGATGNVGREMLNILAEREFPMDEVAAVASPRSTGTEIELGDTGKMLKCQNIEHFDFTGWDIALFCNQKGRRTFEGREQFLVTIADLFHGFAEQGVFDDTKLNTALKAKSAELVSRLNS